MNAIQHLVILARLYGDVTGTDEKTVSWRAFGDSKKLGALEKGADIQVTRYERTLQWFSDNWPADTEWPAVVPRPPISSPLSHSHQDDVPASADASGVAEVSSSEVA